MGDTAIAESLYARHMLESNLCQCANDHCLSCLVWTRPLDMIHNHDRDGCLSFLKLKAESCQCVAESDYGRASVIKTWRNAHIVGASQSRPVDDRALVDRRKKIRQVSNGDAASFNTAAVQRDPGTCKTFAWGRRRNVVYAARADQQKVNLHGLALDVKPQPESCCQKRPHHEPHLL